MPLTTEQKQIVLAEYVAVGGAALAERFNVTRNVVLGFAFRSGLSRGRSEAHERDKVRRAAAKKRAAVKRIKPAQQPRLPKAPPSPVRETVDAFSRTILTVRYGECRWMTADTDAATSSTPVCGAPVKPGSAFCPHHHAKAYRGGSNG